MRNDTTFLNPEQVPPHLRAGYAGKKFKARACESVTVPSDAGLWSGGSRDTYRYIRLSDGATVTHPMMQVSPFNEGRQDHEITLQLGFAIVQSTMFRGVDHGLTFHLHPSDIAAMLPAPAAELSALEKIVLEYTASRKSSYGGKDRRQMYNDDCRYSSNPKPEVSADEWNAAKATLIGKGLLNKAGAITVAGKNAR